MVRVTGGNQETYKLSCIGRDREVRTFEFKIEEDSDAGEWQVKVTTIPPPPSGDFFELALAKIRPDAVRVIMAKHHGRPEYVAMGIPEALLPEIKKILGLNVESSPRVGSEGGVYRTDSATKYWKRLEKQGKATYDPDRDIYTVA